jgi:hypothetical protein
MKMPVFKIMCWFGAAAQIVKVKALNQQLAMDFLMTRLSANGIKEANFHAYGDESDIDFDISNGSYS